MGKTCGCVYCTEHEKYTWAVVMKCGCSCHTDDGMTGHESLCCEIPNGLKVNNPFPELQDKEVCKKIISDFEDRFNEYG